MRKPLRAKNTSTPAQPMSAGTRSQPRSAIPPGVRMAQCHRSTSRMASARTPSRAGITRAGAAPAGSGAVTPGNQDKGGPEKRRASAGLLARRGSKKNPGNVLLSHQVPLAVPSALEGLTAVFGMGTGVAPPP